jgi:transcriptional regulator with XRE-family HTH domain
MQTYAYIGQAIRDRRTALGWSQQDLATSAGINRSSIAMIETARQQVSLDQLIDLARALRVDYRDLLPPPDYLAASPSVRVTAETVRDQAPTTAGVIERLQRTDLDHERAPKEQKDA